MTEAIAATEAIVSSTLAYSGSTADPTPNDEDAEIPVAEKKDEINDSKKLKLEILVKIFPSFSSIYFLFFALPHKYLFLISVFSHSLSY